MTTHSDIILDLAFLHDMISIVTATVVMTTTSTTTTTIAANTVAPMEYMTLHCDNDLLPVGASVLVVGNVAKSVVTLHCSNDCDKYLLPVGASVLVVGNVNVAKSVVAKVTLHCDKYLLPVGASVLVVGNVAKSVVTCTAL